MAQFYHVEITPKVHEPPHRRVEVENNLLMGELEQRFIAPFRIGEPIVIRGRYVPMDDLHRIRIYMTGHETKEIDTISKNTMADVTKEFITGAPGWGLKKEPANAPEARPKADSRIVFVVHGRNNEARSSLFTFLRSIGLDPLEWSKARQLTGKPSPYVGEILDAAFSHAQAAVVLFTPDDEARLKEQLRADGDPFYETELTGQARPNVLFEAGMAMARHQDRTILVELGTLRPFSDTAGIHTVRMDDSSEQRQELAQRLRDAGCPVDLSGTDWHTAGEFERTVAQPVQEPAEPIYADQWLPKEATSLLVEAAIHGRGLISKTRTMGGLRITTKGREFCESGDPRSEAAWTSALNALVHEGLVEDRVGKGTVFSVTDKGFKYADGLDSD